MSTEDLPPPVNTLATESMLDFAMKGKWEGFSRALSQGANVHAVDCWRRSAIVLAIEGLRLGARDRYKSSDAVPLEEEKAERLLIINALIDQSVDLEAFSPIDPRRAPLLHLAAVNGFSELVVLLLKRGASPDSLDNSYCNALERIVPKDPARDSNDRKTVQALLEGGVSPYRDFWAGGTVADYLMRWDPDWAGPLLATFSKDHLSSLLDSNPPPISRSRL